MLLATSSYISRAKIASASSSAGDTAGESMNEHKLYGFFIFVFNLVHFITIFCEELRVRTYHTCLILCKFLWFLVVNSEVKWHLVSLVPLNFRIAVSILRGRFLPDAMILKPSFLMQHVINESIIGFTMFANAYYPPLYAQLRFLDVSVCMSLHRLELQTVSLTCLLASISGSAVWRVYCDVALLLDSRGCPISSRLLNPDCWSNNLEYHGVILKAVNLEQNDKCETTPKGQYSSECRPLVGGGSNGQNHSTQTQADEVILIHDDLVVEAQRFPNNVPLRVNQNMSASNRSKLRVFDFWGGSQVPLQIANFAKELGWDVIHNCTFVNRQKGLECGHLAVEVMHRVGLLVMNDQDWFSTQFEDDVLNSRGVFIAEQNPIIGRHPLTINQFVNTTECEMMLRSKRPIPQHQKLPGDSSKWWCNDASGGPNLFLFKWLVDWEKRSEKCVHICLVNTSFEQGTHWFVVVFEYGDEDIHQFLLRFPTPERYHPFYTSGVPSLDILLDRVRVAAGISQNAVVLPASRVRSTRKKTAPKRLNDFVVNHPKKMQNKDKPRVSDIPKISDAILRDVEERLSVLFSLQTMSEIACCVSVTSWFGNPEHTFFPFLILNYHYNEWETFFEYLMTCQSI